MALCEKCKTDYPVHLINCMYVTGCHLDVCPICALAISNEVHGMERENFAKGSLAQAMLEEAREIQKKSEAAK